MLTHGPGPIRASLLTPVIYCPTFSGGVILNIIRFSLPKAVPLAGKKLANFIPESTQTSKKSTACGITRLFDIEKKIGSREFESMKEYLNFRSKRIPEKFTKFFKLDRKSMAIVRNTRVISEHLARTGYLLFLSNSDAHNRDRMLDYYRSRDIVEKMFDVEKNQLDGKRLRAHTPYNADGRVFVKFVALIN